MSEAMGGRNEPAADPAGERAEIDLRVQDPVVLEEIELYSELIIVAGASEGRLTASEIDRALGVRAANLADSR
jgi:type IV pilus biogenesis protein CpaD/CtpE